MKQTGYYRAYITYIMYSMMFIIVMTCAVPVYAQTNSTFSRKEHIYGKYVDEKQYVHEKYYADEKHHADAIKGLIAFTERELDVIKHYPKLIVEIEPSAAPLQYIDARTGEPKGAIIDLLNKVSKKSGIKFEYIAANHKGGRCEGKADLYTGYYKERYSVPTYLTHKLLAVPIVFIAPDQIDLSQPIKGAVEADDIDINLLTKKYPQIILENYCDIKEISKAFNQGEVNVAITSLYTFNELIKYNNNNNYMAYPTGIEADIGLAVSKKLPNEIVTIINKAVDSISKSERESAIFSNSIRYTNESFMEAFIRKYFVEIAVTLISILLIIVCLVMIILGVLYSKKRVLQKVAYEDQVTGLSTLMKFKADASKVLEHAKSGDYIMISLDIDKFSYINNWLGYEVGNEVLRVLGSKLYELADEGTLIARAGANSFVILAKISNARKHMSIDQYSEVIMSQIEAFKGFNYRLTFNVGFYIIRDLKQDVSHIIDCAHIARKHAKGQYGNSVSEYTEEMNEVIQKERRIILEMEQSLKSHDFKILLQPKVNLLTEKIEGAEVLVRWCKPDGQIIYPDEFIPLFEKNGFIYHLDLYMFESTCRLIKEWQKKGIKSIPKLSVNLSKVTLLSEGLCDILIHYINIWEVNVNDIELELTESTFAEHMEQTIQVVARLKQLGFKISLDDFGSGYSSLNMLKDIEVDVIKIDKGFLNHYVLNSKDIEIIRSSINLAKVLNIETIIEGVETKEQVNILKEMGCERAQGYYFARPLMQSDFEDLIL